MAYQVVTIRRNRTYPTFRIGLKRFDRGETEFPEGDGIRFKLCLPPATHPDAVPALDLKLNVPSPNGSLVTIVSYVEPVTVNVLLHQDDTKDLPLMDHELEVTRIDNSLGGLIVPMGEPYIARIVDTPDGDVGP